jgi:hypothetical protein
MIESKQTEQRDHLKDFPGLGSPIIEEINNFHLIEKKLLGYHAQDHDEDEEFEKFNAKLKEDCKLKNGELIRFANFYTFLDQNEVYFLM